MGLTKQTIHLVDSGENVPALTQLLKVENLEGDF